MLFAVELQYYVLQSQKVVTAYFLNGRLLPFDFAEYDTHFNTNSAAVS